MRADLSGMTEKFRDLKVLVIGEAMLDSYLHGGSNRLCREAPVPVVAVAHREDVPGGAANTAVNVRSLGAEPWFLSVAGNDTEAATLRRALGEQGVSMEHLLCHPDRTTLAKQRILADGHMLARLDQGSTHPVEPEAEEALLARLEALFPQAGAVIVSDYDYGIVTPKILQALVALQAAAPRLLVVDSKRLAAYQAARVTAVKPNYEEAIQLLGLSRLSESHTEERVHQIESHGRRILEITGAQIAVVTIDHDGSLVFQGNEAPYRTYARPRPNSYAAGAGDTFVSALTLALASGAVTENAAELAAAAASVVVSQPGTASCRAEDLRAYFATDDKLITDMGQLTARVAAYRWDNRRIVFTNGCFDILHRGHINYLNRAKSFGDVLVVGLNSDASVKRLKGPSRPINSTEDRAQVLAALSCVDHIVPFDTDTPHGLIEIIKPDLYIKGGDYTRETLPEVPLVEQLGGRVHILPFLEDHSTTGIVERIRQLYAPEQMADSR